MWRGGTLISRLRIWPRAIASRCSTIASMCQPGTNGVDGSTTGHAHYAAAKSGVVTFTISLSREVAAKGINVNALALGMVETPMSSEALKADRAYYEKRIQIGRIAKPEEVAGFAVFLVSGAADYFTGATYDASGGMIAR